MELIQKSDREIRVLAVGGVMFIILAVVAGTMSFLLVAGGDAIPAAFGGSISSGALLLVYFAQSIPEMLGMEKRRVWFMAATISLAATIVSCLIAYFIAIYFVIPTM